MVSNILDYSPTLLELAPVFLVGCPRSGTTLLQQMLDAHSDIAIAPETHFIEKFWLRRDEYGDLAENNNYQKLIDDITKIPEFSEMSLSAEMYAADAFSIERSYPSLFYLLLKQFMQIRNVRMVGEKTPNHLLHIETLKDFFPNARFVHIVRDPRAVVNSWKKVPWTTGTVLGDAKIWRKYMISAQSEVVEEGNLLTLQYESLVSSPEQSLRRICDFLNVIFDANMLNYYSQQSNSVNVGREPWKGNATKPVNPASLTRWQTDLEIKEIAEIEAIAKCQMQQCGYKPYAPKWRVLKVNAQLKIKQLIGQAITHIKSLILR